MSELKQQPATTSYAIRFGLAGIKAVGFAMTDKLIGERNKNGKFSDIYDLASRLDSKHINKKSIEALSKSGAFDSIHSGRRQIFESFEILSAYASQASEAASSNQMSLFDGIAEMETKPTLKTVTEWSKKEILQKEFEAFGFFLNEHPINEFVLDLRKRGVVFSDKIERDELKDNDLIKIAGVVAASKHRSSARGRFAYLTISDPFGIFEILIFDEQLITNARDLIADGSMIVAECAIKKDEGGIRTLARDIKKLDDFIAGVAAKEEIFEDIRAIQSSGYSSQKSNKQWSKKESSDRKFSDKKGDHNINKSQQNNNSYQQNLQKLGEKSALPSVQIILKEMDAVLAVKAFLSQKLAPSDTKNLTQLSRVFFLVMRQGKIFKIELEKDYLIEERDVSLLRKISGVIDVEA